MICGGEVVFTGFMSIPAGGELSESSGEEPEAVYFAS